MTPLYIQTTEYAWGDPMVVAVFDNEKGTWTAGHELVAVLGLSLTVTNVWLFKRKHSKVAVIRSGLQPVAQPVVVRTPSE